MENLVIDDDRNLIRPGDPTLLIVEDDVTFARILLDLAHEKNLRVLVALRGGPALALAREFKPGAITLDINLPRYGGMDDTRPVETRSGHAPHPGAYHFGRRKPPQGPRPRRDVYLEKATTRENLEHAFTSIEQSVQYRVKKLLLVTDDADRSRKMQQSLAGDDLEILSVTSGGEALAMVRQQYLDSIVIDLRLPDIPALDLVEEIHQFLAGAETSSDALSIILYGRRVLSGAEASKMQRLAQTGIVQHARSLEELLDRTVLLLHRAESSCRMGSAKFSPTFAGRMKR